MPLVTGVGLVVVKEAAAGKPALVLVVVAVVAVAVLGVVAALATGLVLLLAIPAPVHDKRYRQKASKYLRS